MVLTMEKTSPLWIYGFIGVGAFAFTLTLVIPPLLGKNVTDELKRYRECQVAARSDCHDSFVWRLYDIALIQSGAPELTKDSYRNTIQGLIGGGRAKKPLQSSPSAPLITSAVLVDHKSGQDGYYRIQGATKVKVRTGVQGEVAQVELYLVPKGVETPGIPEKQADFKKVEEGYEAEFLLENGFIGELEIRATNKAKEMGQLYFDIVAE